MSTETNTEHADTTNENDNGRIRLALDRIADAISAATDQIVAAIAAAANRTNTPNP